MANVRKTQREMYAEIKALVEKSGVANATELVEFIDKKVEQLEHKSDSKKMTAKQTANAEIKEKLVEFLEEQTEKLTCTEIFNMTDIGLTSATHASALLKQLVEIGKVSKTYEKKVAKFYVATDVAIDGDEG